jgi:hypothetical protein
MSRSTLIAFAVCIVLLVVSIGVMSSTQMTALAVMAFWLAMVTVAAALSAVAVTIARWVTPKDHPENQLRSHQIAAATVALVISSALAPAAAGDIIRAVSATAHAIFIDTPEAVAGSCQVSGGALAARIVRRMTGQAVDVCQSRDAAPPDPGGAHHRKGDSPGVGAAAQADIIEYQASPAVWMIFVAAFLSSLLLFRNVVEAHKNYEEQNRARREGQPAPPSTTIMTYPTWVAFFIYLCILAPAAYFSVGTLLFLRIDAPQADITSFTTALSDAARTNQGALQSPVNFSAIRAGINAYYASHSDPPPQSADAAAVKLPDVHDVDRAVEAANKSMATMDSGPDDFRQMALEYAIIESNRITAAELTDYKALMVSQYVAGLQSYHAEINNCLGVLAPLQTALTNDHPVAPPAPPKLAISHKGAPTPSPPPQTVADAAIQTNIADQLASAVNNCRKLKFPAPAKYQDINKESETPLGHAYQWLAACSESTVLIVGLIGFGLFGAAIRMMGRPNSPDADTDGAPSGQALAAALADRRNTIVAEKAPGEFEVTGAAARVLVQGVGAAFTVFLGGQAGAILLASGSRPNAYSLLLLCFIGAVFAEEIWDWAQVLLRTRTRAQVSNGGGPPPSTALSTILTTPSSAPSSSLSTGVSSSLSAAGGATSGAQSAAASTLSSG